VTPGDLGAPGEPQCDTWRRRSTRAGMLLFSASMHPENDLLAVNCGRCGKKIFVRVEDVRELRIIDCPECARKESESGLKRPAPVIPPETESE
jgi:hypothetical protein